MPCHFYPDQRHTGEAWRTTRSGLTPAVEPDETFHVLTNNHGGGCARCRVGQNGVCWGSNHYVLCVTCATQYFGAPDLRVYDPRLFDAAVSEDDSAAAEDAIEDLRTKRDSDFNPENYGQSTHYAELSGRHGCCGYRCTSYAAPNRTIPANTPFMMHSGGLGHLCLACFAKLKAKFDAMPERRLCNMCGNRSAATNFRPVVYNPSEDMREVCRGCLSAYYMDAPRTDRGYIRRDHAVSAMTIATETMPAQRVYASLMYAERHWFNVNEVWYASQEEADRHMFAIDTSYRDRKLAEHAMHSAFSYGTNVIKMHGFPAVTRKDDLCFGVELEMQPNRSNTHTKLIAALGGKYVADRPYILCRDSSIGEAGVELITLPYTLDNHKSDKYMPWTSLLAELRKVGQSGQNTTQCGMHVHINKRALSHLQLGKMMVIINTPEMQELIVTIAQRSEASYCGRYIKKVADGGKLVGDRHDALSTAKMKGTAELRIFRGNLRYERVMKNLEFAHALCMYGQEQSIQRIHVPEEMVSFIHDNRGIYPHLSRFIRDEYRPTKSFARLAARHKASGDWTRTSQEVTCEPTEGDI